MCRSARGLREQDSLEYWLLAGIQIVMLMFVQQCIIQCMYVCIVCVYGSMYMVWYVYMEVLHTAVFVCIKRRVFV